MTSKTYGPLIFDLAKSFARFKQLLSRDDDEEDIRKFNSLKTW